MSLLARIAKARKNAQFAIESLYEGVCNIYTYEETQADTGENVKDRQLLYEAVPCRISFDNSPAASDADTVDTIAQGITLFLPPLCRIPPGCFIEVTQNGNVTAYQNSGPAKIYATHQEIALNLAEEYV